MHAHTWDVLNDLAESRGGSLWRSGKGASHSTCRGSRALIRRLGMMRRALRRVMRPRRSRGRVHDDAYTVDGSNGCQVREAGGQSKEPPVFGGFVIVVVGAALESVAPGKSQVYSLVRSVGATG